MNYFGHDLHASDDGTGKQRCDLACQQRRRHDWQQQQAAHPLPVSTPPALEVRRFHWPYIHPISLGEHPMSPAGTSSLGPEASEHVCQLL